jgi:hypothetical protein
VRLLSGITTPVERMDVWCGMLRLSGTLGRDLETDLRQTWDQSADLSTVEGLQVEIVRSLYVVQNVVVCTAMMAKHLDRELDGLDAAVRDTVFSEAYSVFLSTFTRQCASLQVTAALSGTEPLDEREACFRSALNLLPDHFETLADQEEVWPKLSEGLETLRPLFRVLVNQKTGFLFRCLPGPARLLYLRCLLTFAASQEDDVQHFIRQQHTGPVMDNALAAERQMGSTATIADGGEDNLVRHYHRWNALASLAVIAMRSLHSGIVAASRTPAQDIPQLRDDCSIPWPDFPEGSLLFNVQEAMDRFREEHVLVGGEWIITPPGMSPTTGLSATRRENRSDRSDGIKFLQGQLALPNSTYRIPKIGGSQMEWEEWLVKIKTLQTLFNDFPATIIIPMLTGSVPAHDRRIFGWFEKMVALEHAGRTPTLLEFLDHVRKQVIPNKVVRREAYMELEKLCRDYRKVTDCQALSTKLKQLWAQLYPLEIDEDSEVEPVSKVQVLRSIHTLLQDIKVKSKGGRTDMMNAWGDWTAYDNAHMFATYVDSVLHTSKEATDSLATAFLQDVCSQLEKAHRMSIQVGPSAKKGHEQIDLAGSEKEKLRAAALLLDQPADLVATWINSVGENSKRRMDQAPTDEPGASRSRSSSRGRGGSRGASSAGRGRSKNPQQPPAPTGRSANRPAPLELETDYRVIYTKMRNSPYNGYAPDKVVGNLREALGLPRMTFDQAVDAVVNQRGCTICQLDRDGPDGHVGKHCPHLRHKDQMLRQRAHDFLRALKVARVKDA